MVYFVGSCISYLQIEYLGVTTYLYLHIKYLGVTTYLYLHIKYLYHYVKKYLQSDWLAHACYYQYSIFLRVKIWSGNTLAAL